MADGHSTARRSGVHATALSYAADATTITIFDFRTVTCFALLIAAES